MSTQRKSLEKLSPLNSDRRSHGPSVCLLLVTRACRWLVSPAGTGPSPHPACRALLAGAAILALGVPALAKPIVVPVRWCVLIGDGPSYVSPAVVGESSIKGVLWRRTERASDKIYLNQMNLRFRSGATFDLPEYPEIPDPKNLGSPGDVLDFCCDPQDPNNFEAREEYMVAKACKEAWESPVTGDPQATGVIGVQINRFVDQNENRTSLLGVARGSLGGYFLVADAAYTRPDTEFTLGGGAKGADYQEKVVGHELFHLLGVSHCDPDLPTCDLTCPTCDKLNEYNFPPDPDPAVSMFGTIITQGQSSKVIELLQEGLIPGTMNIPDNPPPLLSNYRLDALGDAGGFGWGDINEIGASTNPFHGQIRFAASFRELYPDAVVFNTYFFADIDNNAATGGDPSQFLPSPLTSQGGVELAVIAGVSVFNSQPAVNVTLHEWDGSQFIQISDPGIQGEVESIEMIGDYLFDNDSNAINDGYLVRALIPEALISPLGDPILLEVRTIAPLPDPPFNLSIDQSRHLLPFARPEYPSCLVSTDRAGRGDRVTIQAFEMPADEPVVVFLGDDKVADGVTTDFNGYAELQFDVPTGASPGLRLLTVGVDSPTNAVTADCELQVAVSARVPTLSAAGLAIFSGLLALAGIYLLYRRRGDRIVN